jgi:hypothetical protein
METKTYKPTKEGYDQLYTDNLYLLEISRTVVLNYIILKTENRNEKDRSKELSDLLSYCGINLKSKKIKDADFYGKLFIEFVKEIDSIEYNPELGILDEVVKVANVCQNVRDKVIEYRASKKKKGLFKLVLG